MHGPAKAIVKELKNSYDITAAKRVVLSGGSAGASAVYYHADSMASALKLTAGEVLHDELWMTHIICSI